MTPQDYMRDGYNVDIEADATQLQLATQYVFDGLATGKLPYSLATEFIRLLNDNMNILVQVNRTVRKP